MRVVSVNVGRIGELTWEGHQLPSAFRKAPVAGRVAMRGVNLEGDAQADRRVHGGPRKSVYVYPSEHYAAWQTELAVSTLPWGSFGENLTTVGWTEREAHVDDLVRIGTAELRVTQPRQPCVKMNAAFGRADLIDRFARAGRSGFYLGAVRDGELGAGDAIELLARDPDRPSIRDLLAGSDTEP